MYKVAVLGNKDSIYGFASAGLDIFPSQEPRETLRLIRQLVLDNYAVFYITEELYATIEDQLHEEYDKQALPSIIPIPGIKGNTGIGMERVKKSVERAIGTDIVFNKPKE